MYEYHVLDKGHRGWRDINRSNSISIKIINHWQSALALKCPCRSISNPRTSLILYKHTHWKYVIGWRRKLMNVCETKLEYMLCMETFRKVKSLNAKSPIFIQYEISKSHMSSLFNSLKCVGKVKIQYEMSESDSTLLSWLQKMSWNHFTQRRRCRAVKTREFTTSANNVSILQYR